jgi:hypothetical protein
VLKNNGFHNRHSPFSRPFSPASFFANGEQGWWFDPSNFATLFQDSAGTTPVTAVEQPVGLQLDLSGRGNHRFQSTSANRPVVSARVNLLTKTEEFDNAGWVKVALGLSVSPNVVTAPNGTLTADKLIGLVPLSKEMFSPVAAIPTGVSFTASVAAKAAEYSWVYIACNVDASVNGTFFNLATGQIGNTVGSGSVPAISPLGDGWYRVSSTRTSTSTSGYLEIYLATGNGTSAPSFIGDGTSGIYIWGADLRPTNQGVGLPAYQRVNTSTDYDTTGFPTYIKPNGSNQFMQTNSINFSATDKMTVWQGVRKLSDAAVGIITELSTTLDTNAGTFYILAPGAPSQASYQWKSRGSANPIGLIASPFAAPITNVFAGIGDISGDSMIVRINGSQVATSSADQGTGNFGNFPAYFYSRAGTSVFFNGNDYGSIARGAASTAAQITAGETYINSLTKAYT